MKEEIEINAVIRQKVFIKPADALIEIKKAFGFGDKFDNSIIVDNGVIVHAEDVSYHGSAKFEYTEISNNPNWVNLFNSVKYMEDYSDHPNDPKWQKHITIEPNEDLPREETNSMTI